MKKKLICVTLSTIMTLQSGFNIFASTNEIIINSNVSQIVKDESIEINKEEFQNLSKEVSDKLNVSNMNYTEKETFNLLIEEQVKKAELEAMINGDENFNKDAFRYEITRLFNPRSLAKSVHLPISNKVVAAGIEVAIGALVGGGVSGVQAFIKLKGAEAAKRLFYVTIVDRLTAWGATYLSTSIGILVGYVMSYMSFGSIIADWIDSHDKNGKNGYFDLYLF